MNYKLIVSIIVVILIIIFIAFMLFKFYNNLKNDNNNNNNKKEMVGNKNMVKEISPDKVNEIKNDSNYELIDVRETYEYDSGHIKEAKNIPLSEFNNNINDIDTDKKIVFICRSGVRSKKAANILATKDKYDVYSMTGGMLNWKYDIQK